MFCMSELPKRTTYIFGSMEVCVKYEGWNFNGGNYLFTTDTK